MIDISLTQEQILTCKDLLQDKITGVNISKHHEKMYLRQAEDHNQEITIEAQKKLIDDLEKEVSKLKVLLRKFDRSIKD